ncbi:hypothetical protein [Falsiroseomonas selenitidurans]|uniref:Uncharacterized protein n=1 Tax=Falsiroseomonas selenitidurans TaxID=2716335 RepID=A0ABX1E2Z5_9PROT|nr:hypothetical protein [Falsiroseomonas selenitidurans]NKC30188.1 hypothetical protein [Falsiroseomonas selenitidurans]
MSNNERPVYVNAKAWRARTRRVKDLRIQAVAMEMLGAYTAGATLAFTFDPEAIARLVSSPREMVSAEDVLNMKDDLLLFFVALPDGRWAANPELFSAVDGNPGMES